MGSNKKDNPPRIMIWMVCDVQIIQPKAVPASFGIPYKANIPAITTGKTPKPPLENEIAKLPITKAVNTIPKLISLVSNKTKIAE